MNGKMKAAVIEELGKMVIKEVAMPELLPGSVLIRVESCAI